MKTPIQYNKNINNGLITNQMLSDCLFSVNKRAKNCRDKEREYREKYRNNRFAYDKYDSEEKYRRKKQEYYQQKEFLLSIISPTCIHCEIHDRKIRVYDYDPEYYRLKHKFIYENGYWDKELQEYIEFGDCYKKVKKYYLFYKIENYSFHTPIDEENLILYRDLEVKDIGQITTFGKDISELVSNQFVVKVIDLIKTGKYIFENKDN